jgi:hypothetical protein
LKKGFNLISLPFNEDIRFNGVNLRNSINDFDDEKKHEILNKFENLILNFQFPDDFLYYRFIFILYYLLMFIIINHIIITNHDLLFIY